MNSRRRMTSIRLRRGFTVLFSLVVAFVICFESVIPLAPEKKESFTVYAAEKSRDSFMENLMFVGDSLIFNPEDMAHVFSKHGHQVFAAMGATLPQFYGLTDQEVTIGMKGHTVTGSIAGREYNGIVILMGANDLAIHDVDTVFEQYKKVLAELQSESMVPVYILQIFPVNAKYARHYGNDREKNRRAVELNEKLWLYAGSVEGLYFVDATNGFLGDDGQLLHDYGDGLHMDPEYYGTFYDNIITAMATLREEVQGSLSNPDERLEKYWPRLLMQDVYKKQLAGKY